MNRNTGGGDIEEYTEWWELHNEYFFIIVKTTCNYEEPNPLNFRKRWKVAEPAERVKLIALRAIAENGRSVGIDLQPNTDFYFWVNFKRDFFIFWRK